MLVLYFLGLARAETEKIIFCGKILDPKRPLVQYDTKILTFCGDTEPNNHSLTFVDKLFGSTRRDIGIHFEPNNFVSSGETCFWGMTPKQYERLKTLIKDGCELEFLFDGFSTWAPLGIVKGGVVMYYSHWRFTLYGENGRVAGMSVESERPRILAQTEPVRSSFVVKWGPRDRSQTKMPSQLRGARMELISLLKMFLWVVLIVSVGTILLVMRIAGSKNLPGEETLDDFGVEQSNSHSWTSLHGDVFRMPNKIEHFAAINGAAFHVLISVAVLIFVDYSFEMSKEISLHVLFVLIFTSFYMFAGYIGASIMAQYKRTPKTLSTKIVIGIAVPLFGCLFAGLMLDENMVLRIKGAAVLVLICVVFGLVLCEIGRYIGQLSPFFSENPCQVAALPRNEPKAKAFMNPTVMMVFVAAVCSLVFVKEVRVILLVINANMISTASILMGLSFLTAVALGGFFSVVAIFVLFENGFYKWQWRSFLGPFGSSLFAFCYSAQFVLLQTQIVSWRERLMSFAIALVLSVMYGMVCGSSGFVCTALFVQWMFQCCRGR